MKRISIIMGLSLVLIMGLALQAQAHSIVITGDAASDPNYVITKSTPEGTVFEDYNAKSLIPFTPLTLPTGATAVDAVVDFNLAGAPIFFTKAVTLDSGDTPGNPKNAPFSWEENFHIQNTTPFNWTNYEFIITNLPSGVILAQASNSNELKGETQDASHVEFYATAADQFVAPGKELNVNFKLQIAQAIPADTTLTIDFTQVATANAVPILPSALLLGSGLLGLVGLGWRRKKSQ